MQLSFDWECLHSDEPARYRFEAFHQANPWIMDKLVDMARRLTARGIQHYGIAALWEVLRYDWMIRTEDPTSTLKLNDHYKPFYAREIMRRYQDLDGFFTTRRSQADHGNV
jgi:hypothetical protein